MVVITSSQRMKELEQVISSTGSTSCGHTDDQNDPALCATGCADWLSWAFHRSLALVEAAADDIRPHQAHHDRRGRGSGGLLALPGYRRRRRRFTVGSHHRWAAGSDSACASGKIATGQSGARFTEEYLRAARPQRVLRTSTRRRTAGCDLVAGAGSVSNPPAGSCAGRIEPSRIDS